MAWEDRCQECEKTIKGDGGRSINEKQFLVEKDKGRESRKRGVQSMWSLEGRVKWKTN